MLDKLEDLWKKIADSRLFSPEECRKLAAMFGKERSAETSATALAEWLVNKRYLSRYQAKVLLSGHAGPFVYDPYVVYDRITAGRMTGRFRARHLKSKQKVLLQFLSGPAAQDPQTWASLKRQTALASSLADPHLARCLELVDLGRYKFLVLEDLRGGTVEERLSAQGAIPVDEACRLAQQAALALARLHAAGQIHGDVRPANLWLEEGGQLKLWHFPVARDPLSPAPWLAGPDGWGPQINYLAPELVQPGRAPDVRSDVYSLGCTLYHMLAGRPPFAGPASKTTSPNRESPPPVDQINSNVSGEIAATVSRLMAADPQSRPQQATDVAALLSGNHATEIMAAQEPAAAPEEDLPEAQPPVSAPQPAAATVTSTPGIGGIVTPVATAVPIAPPAAQASPAASAAPEVTAGASFPIVVTRSDPAASARARLAAKRRNRNRLPLAISAIALAAMVAAAALAYVKLSNERVADATTAPVTAAPIDTKQQADDAIHTPSEPRTLEGDLWSSPTSGPPLDLRYLPPGALVVAALRPAALLAHAEGEKTLDALGPLGELARARLPELTGVEFSDMEQVVVGFLDRAPDPPAAAIVVRAGRALSETELLGRWRNPQLDDSAAGRLFRGPAWAYYFPPGGNQRLLAVMSPKDVQDVLEIGDQPPLLRPEVERLVQASDADRALNVLFTPDFLLMPSNPFLSGDAQQLKTPLEDFLGTEVKAGLLSCHFEGQNFFAELLVSGTVERPPMAVAKTLQDRLHAARLRIEDYVRPMSADPYAGKVLFRFPQMLAELEKHTRAAAVDRQVVLRCYLPDRAAHNLALAARLALGGSSGEAAPSVAMVAPKLPPQTIEERLKQITSLSFPLENLENAIATLSDEIGVEMKILGSDLQLEGITRNQQFKDLNEVNKPADEILRQILIKARPDGKLVYVISKDGDRGMVYITTRSKAKERGQLPPELAQ